MISVIIPTFQSERFVEETLQSVFRQTYRDWEILVIDDGSNDRTVEILESHGSKLRIIRQAHAGASAARNRGTAEARGEFIQYLDSDDLLCPDALKVRVAALESIRGGVAYSDWQSLEERSPGEFVASEIHSKNIEDFNSDPEIATFDQFWAPPAALLYSREAVTRIGGWNERLPIIQDARFLYDAAKTGARFVHVPGIGAHYRIVLNQGLSRANPEAFAKDVFTNSLEIMSDWEKRGILGESHCKALCSSFDFVARVFFFSDSELFTQASIAIERLEGPRRSRFVRAAQYLSSRMGFPLARKLLILFTDTRRRLAAAQKL